MPKINDETTIYYLQSIARQLEVLDKLQTFGPTLGGEVLADNREWLGMYIDELIKQQEL